MAATEAGWKRRAAATCRFAWEDGSATSLAILISVSSQGAVNAVDAVCEFDLRIRAMSVIRATKPPK